MRAPVFVLAATGLLLAGPADAQYGGAMGSSWNNPVSALSNVQMWNNINSMTNNRAMAKSSLRKLGCTEAQMNALTTQDELMLALSQKKCSLSGAARAPAGQAQAAAPVSVPQGPAPITFRPTGDRILLPQIVATISDDASEQAALTQLIGGAMNDFEAAERVKGSEYDLASAMSFFASVSIYLQDTGTDMNARAGDALTLSLREALGPKVAGVSDRDKQMLYEALLAYGMFFLLASRQADANTMTQLKQVSAALSKELMGLDVTQYRFVPDGLASVK